MKRRVGRSALTTSLLLLCTADASGFQSRSWYFYPTLGWFRPSYPHPLNEAVEANRSISSFSNLQFETRLGGYLRTGAGKLLAGVAFGAGVDRFGVTGAWSVIEQFSGCMSGLWFSSEPGRGTFARLDLGPAWAKAINSYGVSTGSDMGLAVMAGAGYAIPVSENISATLAVHGGLNFIEGGRYPSLTAAVGALF